jgi:hypothetical protein
MHIQVITGEGRSGKTAQLRHVQELQKWLGQPTRQVNAEAYGADGLVQMLDIRAATGQREILVVECSRDQIQAVLEWQNATDEKVELEDLVIHLVRKVSSATNAG